MNSSNTERNNDEMFTKMLQGADEPTSNIRMNDFALNHPADIMNDIIHQEDLHS